MNIDKRESCPFWKWWLLLSSLSKSSESSRELLNLSTIILCFWNKQLLFKIQSNHCSATTHTDLVLRAKDKDLEYRVIHNASIMNAVGCCGLQVGLVVFKYSLYVLQILFESSRSSLLLLKFEFYQFFSDHFCMYNNNTHILKVLKEQHFLN